MPVNYFDNLKLIYVIKLWDSKEQLLQFESEAVTEAEIASKTTALPSVYQSCLPT